MQLPRNQEKNSPAFTQNCVILLNKSHKATVSGKNNARFNVIYRLELTQNTFLQLRYLIRIILRTNF